MFWSLTIRACGGLLADRVCDGLLGDGEEGEFDDHKINAVMVASSTSRAVHLGPASSTDVISSKAHITAA